MVEVRLFATLRRGREKIYQYASEQAPDGLTVLADLGIGPEEVKIFLINGHHSALDVPLSDGDIVSVFPAVGGG
ncbi:MAG: MoaD/ThiS family protein [Coriobacteriia bacterium]|nr:MoaD/ThiS family protein [Coriobacteriia bacterium]